MLVLISVSAALLIVIWYFYHSPIPTDRRSRKKIIKTIVKNAIATFGLTFWAMLLFLVFYESEETSFSVSLRGGTFKNPQDLMVKVSALFLSIPLIFNLIKMSSVIAATKNWKTACVDFVYNVMSEFGIFWTISVFTAFFIW